jgi:cytoskeletal protein RodZ
MDGVLLVFDTRNLPNIHALAPVTPVPAKALPKRNRAVPAFATLILVLVLGMVYYVSMYRRAAPVEAYTPSAAAATTSEPAPVINPTPEPQPSQEVQAPAPEDPKPEPAKEPELKPAKKQPIKTAAASTQTKTESEPKKDDSKVGSILKKTGRILKKPFKF